MTKQPSVETKIESKAQEMFAYFGYVREDQDDMIVYTLDQKPEQHFGIAFKYKYQTWHSWYWWRDEEGKPFDGNVAITLELNKAIQQQMMELGWIEPTATQQAQMRDKLKGLQEQLNNQYATPRYTLTLSGSKPLTGFSDIEDTTITREVIRLEQVNQAITDALALEGEE